jgi:hypothetical protein
VVVDPESNTEVGELYMDAGLGNAGKVVCAVGVWGETEISLDKVGTVLRLARCQRGMCTRERLQLTVKLTEVDFGVTKKCCTWL